MSLNLKKIKTQFSFALYASTTELYLTKKNIKIKQTVPEIYFGDAQNNKIHRKFNAIIGSI